MDLLSTVISYLIQMERIAVPTYTKYKQEYYEEFLRMYDILIKPVERNLGLTWTEFKELGYIHIKYKGE